MFGTALKVPAQHISTAFLSSSLVSKAVPADATGLKLLEFSCDDKDNDPYQTSPRPSHLGGEERMDVWKGSLSLPYFEM